MEHIFTAIAMVVFKSYCYTIIIGNTQNFTQHIFRTELGEKIHI